MNSYVSIFFLLAAGLNAATITLVPSAASVSTGGSLSVSAQIDSTTPIYGWELTLTYLGTVVHATSALEGGFLATGGSTSFLSLGPDDLIGQYGPVAAALNGAVPGVTGTGTLAVFSFHAAAPGITTFNLIGVTLLDDTLFDVPVELNGITVTVNSSLSPVPEPKTWIPISLAVVLLRAGLARRIR